ncbi:MAG: nuclear transport factor 2 family protein [Verrucomicrobiota bacterium]
MKPILLWLAVLASSALFTLAAENQGSKGVESTFLQLEQQWEDALTRSDISALDKLYDAEITYTHSNGKVDTKSSYLRSIQSGATKYQSMKRDDIKVSVYGQAAVVTCHWEVHVVASGNKMDMTGRYLHVYVQQKDGWKMVAHQSTRISP